MQCPLRKRVCEVYILQYTSMRETMTWVKNQTDQSIHWQICLAMFELTGLSRPKNKRSTLEPLQIDLPIESTERNPPVIEKSRRA